MKHTRHFRPIGFAAAAMAVALTLAACGSSGGGGSKSGGSGGGGASLPGKGKPAVTMGDKDFPEEFLLGELYAQALRAKGFTVTLKKNIGSSEIIDKALTTKKIDLYPEYTGVIYGNKQLANLGDKSSSKEHTYQAAKKWEQGRGYTLLTPTPFQDADGLGVTPAYAKKYNLKVIADMKKVGTFSYLAPKENRNRYQGLEGLHKAYGLTKVQFKAIGTGSQYAPLLRGDVDSIAIFTTDAQLTTGKFKVLTDTKGIFGFQNVAPVVRQSVLKQQGPEFAKTLDTVSALLTFAAILSMNKAVQLNKQEPAVVAKAFLKANKLI